MTRHGGSGGETGLPRAGDSAHDAAPQGDGDGLDAVARLQLAQNRLDVRTDGLLRDEQGTADGPVVQALHQVGEDLTLARGQAEIRAGPGALGAHRGEAEGDPAA